MVFWTRSLIITAYIKSCYDIDLISIIESEIELKVIIREVIAILISYIIFLRLFYLILLKMSATFHF
jgi:hypothetical protein